MVAINTYGVVMFDLDTFPAWANNTGDVLCPLDKVENETVVLY